jgi:hypothetical protein
MGQDTTKINAATKAVDTAKPDTVRLVTVMLVSANQVKVDGTIVRSSLVPMVVQFMDSHMPVGILLLQPTARDLLLLNGQNNKVLGTTIM